MDATILDHKRWESVATRMTISELLYAAKDAREAQDAMRKWLPDREDYYVSKASCFDNEVKRRRVPHV